MCKYVSPTNTQTHKRIRATDRIRMSARIQVFNIEPIASDDVFRYLLIFKNTIRQWQCIFAFSRSTDSGQWPLVSRSLAYNFAIFALFIGFTEHCSLFLCSVYTLRISNTYVHGNSLYRLVYKIGYGVVYVQLCAATYCYSLPVLRRIQQRYGYMKFVSNYFCIRMRFVHTIFRFSSDS